MAGKGKDTELSLGLAAEAASTQVTHTHVTPDQTLWGSLASESGVTRTTGVV